MSNLTVDAVISHGEDQVFTIVDGEAVLMSIGTGRYFKLDDIGTRIWSLIETPTSVAGLCAQLVEEFNVDPAACEADVVRLLERMLSQNLVRVGPGA